MHRKILTIGFMVFWLGVGHGLAEERAPHQIGGFVLGENIASYSDRIRKETALALRHREYIQEVETRPIPGFKSGLIRYGNCAVPGRIVKIKFKYADSSKGFYEDLLARFKKRFGEPDVWRGDPFHIVIAWKWSFTDKSGNHISLTLQHNTKDEEEKMGNSVKVAAWNFIEEERVCFEKKEEQESEKKKLRRQKGPVDWELLLPR